MMINKCVGCVKLNLENSKTFPIICPNSQLPCFAIDPQFLDSLLKNLSAERISCDSKYIDQEFIQVYLNAWNELEKNDKTIYTMQAY